MRQVQLMQACDRQLGSAVRWRDNSNSMQPDFPWHWKLLSLALSRQNIAVKHILPSQVTYVVNSTLAALTARVAVWSATDQITGRVIVAIVMTIGKPRACYGAFALPIANSMESRIRIRLVQRANCIRDVIQFRVDCNGYFAQSNDHGKDADRQDQGQFGRDDQTRFVVPHFLQHANVPQYPSV